MRIDNCRTGQGKRPEHRVAGHDKLKSLPKAASDLENGVDFPQLDAIAYALSANEAARRLNTERFRDTLD